MHKHYAQILKEKQARMAMLVDDPGAHSQPPQGQAKKSGGGKRPRQGDAEGESDEEETARQKKKAKKNGMQRSERFDIYAGCVWFSCKTCSPRQLARRSIVARRLLLCRICPTKSLL